MWPLRRKATAPTFERATEPELIALARNASGAAFQEIMRRNNRRLFRAARSILGTDWEAEEVVQVPMSKDSAPSRAFGRKLNSAPG
jgi:hypothetical protein